MSAVRRLDPATQQVLYVGAEQLLDTVVCEYERSTGDVAVYLDPRSGEEYRWQMAALFANDDVLRRPNWEPALGLFGLREVCESPPKDWPQLNDRHRSLTLSEDDPHQQPPLDDTLAMLLDEIDAVLDKDWVSQEILEGFKAGALTQALAADLRAPR